MNIFSAQLFANQHLLFVFVLFKQPFFERAERVPIGELNISYYFNSFISKVNIRLFRYHSMTDFVVPGIFSFITHLSLLF